jgi:hypothetical protein
MRYWKIAPGENGFLWVEQRENNCIAIGWSEVHDLSKYRNDTEINKEFHDHFPKNSSKQLITFFREVQQKDKIIACAGSFLYGIGVISGLGKYKYNENLYYSHTKPVCWEITFWDPLDIYSLKLPKTIENKLAGKPPRTIREILPDEWITIEDRINNIKTPFKNLTNWEGLPRSPTSEQEVIILFSRLTQYLRMHIEHVSTQFPDAYLRVKKGKEWVLKSAEFELYSSSFETHGHLEQMKKGKKCDMIICWDHDWDQIPDKIEVISLKEIMLEIL